MPEAPALPTVLGAHSGVTTACRTPDASASPASIREMLACLDGSALGCGVVAHAQAVAEAFGARLTLLRVLEAEAGAGAPDSVDWAIREREARVQLDRLVAALGAPESGIRGELIQGRPAEQICSWADHHDVDLTVLCSHGTRGVTEWQLASTARKLVDGTPGSLLLVPAAAAEADKEVRYNRIVVALDGSPRAESILPVAVRIAVAHEAELILAHVVPVPRITRNGVLDSEGAALERRVIAHNRRVAIAYLDRLRARVSQSGVRARALVVGEGHVPTRLQRLIQEEDADLVVMGGHGHDGSFDSPCGSVAEHALTHASVPLLVVRDRHRTRREARFGPRSRGRFAPTQ